jgi:hypothetical protein
MPIDVVLTMAFLAFLGIAACWFLDGVEKRRQERWTPMRQYHAEEREGFWTQMQKDMADDDARDKEERRRRSKATKRSA